MYCNISSRSLSVGIVVRTIVFVCIIQSPNFLPKSCLSNKTLTERMFLRNLELRSSRQTINTAFHFCISPLEAAILLIWCLYMAKCSIKHIIRLSLALYFFPDQNILVNILIRAYCEYFFSLFSVDSLTVVVIVN